MPSISVKMSGVTLNSVHRTAKEGTLKFRANLTAEVMRKMGWGELTQGQTSADMEGVFADAMLILESDQKDLFAGGEARFSVQKVDGFSVQRLELKKKKGRLFRFVVEFEARFVKEGVAALAETWLLSVGSSEANMALNGALVEAKPDPKETAA
jgi:hypothetical protein